jgi:hypothetical protein
MIYRHFRMSPTPRSLLKCPPPEGSFAHALELCLITCAVLRRRRCLNRNVGVLPLSACPIGIVLRSAVRARRRRLQAVLRPRQLPLPLFPSFGPGSPLQSITTMQARETMRSAACGSLDVAAWQVVVESCSGIPLPDVDRRHHILGRRLRVCLMEVRLTANFFTNLTCAHSRVIVWLCRVKSLYRTLTS